MPADTNSKPVETFIAPEVFLVGPPLFKEQDLSSHTYALLAKGKFETGKTFKFWNKNGLSECLRQHHFGDSIFVNKNFKHAARNQNTNLLPSFETQLLSTNMSLWDDMGIIEPLLLKENMVDKLLGISNAYYKILSVLARVMSWMSSTRKYRDNLNEGQKIPKTSPVWLRLAHMSIIYSSQVYEPNKYQPKSYNIQEIKGIKGVVVEYRIVRRDQSRGNILTNNKQ